MSEEPRERSFDELLARGLPSGPLSLHTDQTDRVLDTIGTHITVCNCGGYIGWFQLAWEEDPDLNGQYQKRSWSSGNVTVGFCHMLLGVYIRNIEIKAWAYIAAPARPWYMVMDLHLDGLDNQCYRIGGTSLSPWWDNNGPC